MAGWPEGWWMPTRTDHWPVLLPTLGPRSIGPFDPCAHCGVGSWARYGTTVLCWPCAAATARGQA